MKYLDMVKNKKKLWVSFKIINTSKNNIRNYIFLKFNSNCDFNNNKIDEKENLNALLQFQIY